MKIFISYARKDKKLCEGFRAALAPLARIHGVEAWHDGQILPGGAFEDDISHALETADAVALLVSNHFFVSNYCYGVEMTRALARHDAGDCVVVPVIADFTAWQGAPFAHLNVVPADGKCVRDFKPQNKGWKEVAEGFIRLLKQNPPKASAGLRHLPIPRIPLFTGREANLQWLADTLAGGQPAALLHGMGGVGKTQTAAEYAHRHADSYKVAWWVAAQTETEADAGYAALAEALRLPGYDPRDAAKTRQAVLGWMARESGWLVVLDNAESPKDLAPWLPNTAKGHLLITSRNPNWANRAAVHDLDVWSIPQAADFLLTRSGDKDRAAAEKLAAALGCLPLACETAAAYAAETGGSLARYADLLAQQPVKLLDFLPQDTIYARSLPQVVLLAMEAVERESPLAAAILRGIAWLAPDNIPRWLADVLSEDPITIDMALAVLVRRSLIRKTDDDFFSVHRLTQQIIRDADPNPNESAATATKVLAYTIARYPLDDIQYWLRYTVLLPHGEALFSKMPDVPSELLTLTSSISSSFGVFIAQAIGDYAAAWSWHIKALRATRAQVGPNHIDLANPLANLGELLRLMGNLEKSKELYQQALNITQLTAPSNRIEIANKLGSLGVVLNELNELEDARHCHERCLEFRIAVHGPDHPSVSVDLNNLALVLEKLGDQTGARRCFERALEICLHHPERGADHPDTALRHHNLGAHLFKQGEAAAAEPHLIRALAIREKHLDPNHPHISSTREWLADVRAALGTGDGGRGTGDGGMKADPSSRHPGAGRNSCVREVPQLYKNKLLFRHGRT